MLILVRHGQSAHNAGGLLSGRRDVALTELGREQAAAMAAAVGPVDRVIASPLRRAQETASAFGRPVETDERWIELDYGEFDGLAATEVPEPTWAAWRADPGYRPPGGESLRDVRRRVEQACRALPANETVVVVSHVSPIKAAVAWALGVEDEISWRLFLAPASITRIAIGARGPSLHAYNVTTHLT